MAGVRPLELDFGDMLDVFYALMVDDLLPHVTVQVADDKVELHHRARVKADVEGRLAKAEREVRPGRFDPETWGLLPEHRAATAAALAFTGGPAAPRGRMP